MTALLETRKPASQQFIPERRALVTAYLVHTAENILDEIDGDTGAEGVAEFIATRSDAGSYHDLADSDSVVEVIPPWWEAFHCRGGVNRWAMGLSFACRAVDWPRMTPERRAGFIRHGARIAAKRILWIEGQDGWAAHARAKGYAGGRFPVRWITKEQADAGESGFVGHGQMDRGRRSDPGPLFPQDEFLGAVRVALDIARREAGQMPENGDDEMAKTWTLNDLGATLDNVGAFYERDAVRRLPADTDWRSVDFRGTVLAGRNAWYDEVVKTLKAGTDPVKLLEFVEWALANPEAAAKL